MGKVDADVPDTEPDVTPRVDAQVDGHVDDQVLSDETMGRIVTWGLIGLGVIILVIGVAALANWLNESNSTEPPFGATEVGFLQDMIDHHEQGLLISETYLANNPDGDAASYARDVVLFQTRDIGRMENWLDDAG